MDAVKGKGKKNLLLKTLDRCRSIKIGQKRSSAVPSSSGGGGGGTGLAGGSFSKCKSWHGRAKVAPHGCFSVYVGPERERFVMKAKFANHPLFKMLLEDAESEYGYSSEGPLVLPCEVGLFCKVLAEMDGSERDHDEIVRRSYCGFAYGSCSPFSPSWRLQGKGSGSMGKGYHMDRMGFSSAVQVAQDESLIISSNPN